MGMEHGMELSIRHGHGGGGDAGGAFGGGDGALSGGGGGGGALGIVEREGHGAGDAVR